MNASEIFAFLNGQTHLMQRLILRSSGFIHTQIGKLGFVGRFFPKTLISFLLVGSLGVLVHMTVLKCALFFLTSDFRLANGSAMLVAATFNYLLNNQSTFSERSLGGKHVLLGYALYLGITSIGLLASLSISTWIFNQNSMPMVAALCGIIVGALWNYLMTYNFVWKLLSGAFRRT